MNIHFPSLLSDATSQFQQAVVPTLTIQKKIFDVASIAFGLLIACYTAYFLLKKLQLKINFKPLLKVHTIFNNSPKPKVEDEVKELKNEIIKEIQQNVIETKVLQENDKQCANPSTILSNVTNVIKEQQEIKAESINPSTILDATNGIEEQQEIEEQSVNPSTILSNATNVIKEQQEIKAQSVNPSTILSNTTNVIEEQQEIEAGGCINRFNTLKEELIVHIFSQLEHQDWMAISLTDKRFHHLSLKPEVISLIFQNNQFFISFSKLKELALLSGHLFENLNLAAKFFDNQQLDEIFKICPNIKNVNLSGSPYFTNETVEILSKQNLQSLDLSSWQPTEFAIEKLSKNLKSLTLRYCTGVTEAILAKLSKDLKSLDISRCGDLTDINFNKLPQGLLSLNLSRSIISDTAINQLPQTLEHLDLSFIDLTTIVIDHLPPRLLSIVLEEVKKPGATIDKLPQGLLSLNLSQCTLSDEMIVKLPQGLHSLTLSWCKGLTIASIDKLPPGLQLLNMQGFHKRLTACAINKYSKSIVQI